MALLHEATITPRKDDLIEPWLRTRAWWDGAGERGPVASFRLDDPAGQVGMECLMLGSESGSTLFVPVTYRGTPLAGAEPGLLGTVEHSVLGTRYVYDACCDPVFVAAVLDTIRSGSRQAELRLLRADGTEVVREPAATARGEGVPSVPTHDPGCPVWTGGRGGSDHGHRRRLGTHCHAAARRSTPRSRPDRKLRGRGRPTPRRGLRLNRPTGDGHGLPRNVLTCRPARGPAGVVGFLRSGRRGVGSMGDGW